MPKPDFTLKFIKDADELQRLSHVLVTLPAFALDIETTEWWNRHRERIALIQIAFRVEERVKVFIIDALADFDPELLRLPLENPLSLKSSITPHSMRRVFTNITISALIRFSTRCSPPAAQVSGNIPLKHRRKRISLSGSTNRRKRAIGAVARSITGNYITLLLIRL